MRKVLKRVWPIVIGTRLFEVGALSYRIHGRPLLKDFLDIVGAIGLPLMFVANGWLLARVHGTAESTQTSYAALWFRFVAGIIDVLSAGVVIMAVARTAIDALGSAGYIRGADRRLADFGTSAEQWAIALFSYWLYSAVMESSPLEATVGKLMLRLRVTDADGHRISFIRATGRYWGKIVSLGTFFIGFLMAVGNDRKQALHDRLAQTVVIEV